MIRFLLRFVGLIFLAIGFIFLVYDGTKSIAANAMVVTPLSEMWNDIHASSLLLLQSAVENRFGEWAWDPLFQPVLRSPTWLVFAVLGAVLLLLGRKKKPLIGYARD
jgi:hypothetical protein